MRNTIYRPPNKLIWAFFMSGRTNAQRNADQRYGEKLERLAVNFNIEKPDDAELWEKLEGLQDRTALVKQLLRQHFNKNKAAI